MAIIRAPRPERGFVQLDNSVVRDESLSFRARGILAYLLSHTEGWATDAVSIARQGKEGRDAVRKALSELEEAGYLVRPRLQNARGRFRTEVYVFDMPIAPGTDVAVLLGHKEPGSDLSTGPVDDEDADPEDGKTAGQTEDGFPVVGEPGVGAPAVGLPDVGIPGVNYKKTNEKTKKGGDSLPHHQSAPVDNPPDGRGDDNLTPRRAALASPGPAPTGQSGRLPGWDEFGPLAPRCADHAAALVDVPCRRCGTTRERYEGALPKREAALRRAESAAAFERERREYANAVPAKESAHAKAAREALRRTG